MLVACQGPPTPAPAQAVSDAVPSSAAPTNAAPAPRYSEVMVEVGRRFQRAGRAGLRARWGQAFHDLEALQERLREDLPRARPPEGCRVDLGPVALAFAEAEVPRLSRAVAAKDPSKVRDAYAEVARACNRCHATAGVEFFTVSEDPEGDLLLLGEAGSPSAPAAGAPSGPAPAPP